MNEKEYFTLRTDTRIQNYKCLTPVLSPSPLGADRKETVEANKQFCKRLQIPTSMIKI